MKKDSQPSPHLVNELARIVTPHHVLTEPDLTARYETDWTRRFRGKSLCVVRPGSTEEAAEVVKACLAYRTPIIPQGGATGLVGGSVPAPVGPRPVLLSTRRLDWIDVVDKTAAQVT